MLQFAGRIAFGVDIADFLQLQRAFERQRIHRAAAEEEHVAGARQVAGDLGDLGLQRQRAGHEAGHAAERRGQALFLGRVEMAALAAGHERQRREHGQLAGEGLGRGDADLRAGEDGQRHVALARDGRGLDVDDRDDPAALGTHVAQRRQRVGRLARLADEDADGARAERRLAVAELGGDLDLHRQAGEPFEPVLRHVAGVVRRAAGHQHQAVAGGEVDAVRGGRRLAVGGEVARERVGDHRRLLVHLLGHEVLVGAFLGVDVLQRDVVDLAGRRAAVGVEDVDRLAGEDGVVALVEVGDAVGEGGEGQRVGADEDLAVAIADGQGRAAAGGDEQVFLAGEEEAEGEGAVEPGQGGAGGFDGGAAFGDLGGAELGDGLGVGVGLEDGALGLELGAQGADGSR